jgi:hypothetical protein
LITFLPNWLREHDPVFRLTSNGATNALITEILNHHHESSDKGDVMNNSVCKMTQTAMRQNNDYLYPVSKMVDDEEEIKQEKWSILHHNKSNTKDHWENWDSRSLAVGKVHYGNHNRSVPLESVDFKILGKGVKVFPSLENGDGLDLTRCVQYAMKHKDKTFMFPDDFSKICDIVGRMTVQEKHRDGPAFKRWTTKLKDNKKAARLARLAAPPTGGAKTTSNKVGKTRFIDNNDKIKKLKAKINEAVQNGRLDLGPNGQLILLDKPKHKVQPVSPAAGPRTHSSAYNSPLLPDGHHSQAGIYNSMTVAAGSNSLASSRNSLASSRNSPTGAAGYRSQVGVHTSQADFVSNNFDAGSFTNPDAQKAYNSGFYGYQPTAHSGNVVPSPTARVEVPTRINSAGYTEYDDPYRRQPSPFLEHVQHGYHHDTNRTFVGNAYGNQSNSFTPADNGYAPTAHPSMASSNATAFASNQTVMGQAQYPVQSPLGFHGLVQDGPSADVSWEGGLEDVLNAESGIVQHLVEDTSGADDGWSNARYRGDLGVDLDHDLLPMGPHRG